MIKKFFKTEDGFTLVELLVTIAILGVLFGVVTLTLSGVGTDAEATVETAELAVVQSAIDVYMASYNDSAVDVLNPAECLDGTEVIDTTNSVTTGDYLRSDSKCLYSWIADGTVTQGACTCP
ncbi:MAG: prepilin-type N-terminal cleavage/methylation domain-containing protein [Anaerolineales bacterium]